MNTAAFITFGCKINQYETEAIRQQVLALGYEEVPPSEPADLYVINTCAVTAEGFAKSRRSVLRAARTSPGGRILVVGCSMPAERAGLASIPQVALVTGNEEKHLVPSFLRGEWRPGESAPRGGDGILGLRVSGFSHRTRATVKVQDGCNSFCSFCIIPFLRGRSKSRAPGDVLDEVRRLVDAGYREVVVSGVHIQDYGADLEGPWSLARLLGLVVEVPGVRRVRLSSLGVRALTPALLDVLGHPRLCPHWHLPLQAGSDAVLERMRRDYRVQDYLRGIERLRERFEAPSFSTDVIVGYPGESAVDFEGTLAVCREVGFSKIHVFPYSRRDGTLAAKLGGDLPPREIRTRARVLRRLEGELGLEYRRQFIGATVAVLVEGEAPRRSREGRAEAAFLEGLTERYVKVRFPAPPAGGDRLRGAIQPVRVLSVESGGVLGGRAGSGRGEED
jgi:threonylcarbamoyladenosine tRNA methylthiotransferase MtaB